MKLHSFRIYNVKSIVDSGLCYLSDDGITVLAGQNEVGKSAILEGLNYFSNGPSKEFTRLSKRFDSSPRVNCWFNLEDIDRENAGEDVKTVLKELNTVCFIRDGENGGDTEGISITKGTDDEIQKLATEKLPPKDTGEETTQYIDAVVAEVEQHIINRLPTFILFDSFSDLLPGEILISEIPSNRAVQDFQKVFNIDFALVATKPSQERNSLVDATEKRASLDLNTYWSQVLTTAADDKYNFHITLIPSTNPLEAKVEFLIDRNDSRQLYLEQKSKGFQWFNAFNLRLKSLGVKANELENYVILIDEPGQGLHETAQKDVKTVLEELARKHMQIVYTTHNASLIGVEGNEILRLRLVYQNNSKETVIQNITQFSSSSDENNKDALSPIITAMGISHIGSLIDREKVCVVLEGITDHYYFSAIRLLLDKEDKYFFIPACGAPNIRPLISIVMSWTRNFKAVFDDGKEGRTVYASLKRHLYNNNEDIFTKQVYKLEGFEGIEDLFSQDDFDKYVVGAEREDKTMSNSNLAKSKKKELLARMFLYKVQRGEVTLSEDTLTNFRVVFDWIQPD